MVANLKALRLKKGVSQQRLADALGITQQAVNKYENHSVEPDIYMLMRMADYFETSIDYLVGHTGAEQRSDIKRPYDLNGDEAALIDKYRLLSEKERESIRLVTGNYLAGGK